jgi:hypothetical protein
MVTRIRDGRCSLQVKRNGPPVEEEAAANPQERGAAMSMDILVRQ